MVYLLSSCCLLLFSSSSFYFFLVLQSVSLFSIIHYFGDLSFNVSSLCYVLVTLLSDIMIVYGFISVSLNFLFFGFMLKLSFFPFLWFIPSIVLNMSYPLICFLVFFHKVVVILVCYYIFLGFSAFYNFIILLSIFISSCYLILNKNCLKSILVWSSNVHCGWFIFLLNANSYFAFTYILIYLVFGLLAVYSLSFGYEFLYLSDLVSSGSSVGLWYWFSFLFFCSFPPMIGWVLKFLIYFSISNYVLFVLVIILNLVSTFCYLVILSSFFICLPYYNRISLFLYLISFTTILLCLFLF